MRINLDEMPLNTPFSYDVAILGSGPAGMTVCRELSDAGLKIVVVESGDMKPTSEANELRMIETHGMGIKEYSRERIVGGTSTTWSGLAAPLDPVDFERRSFLKVDGWPIEYEALQPYWAAASERYGFPPVHLFNDFKALRKESALRPEWKCIEEKIFLAATPSQHFAKKWGNLFESKIDLLTNATVSELQGKKNGKKIKNALIVSTLHPEQTYVLHARFFILATGGIENARLLIASQDLCPQGLGNEHDQVGRYFMNHPKSYYGILTLKRPIRESTYFFGCLKEGYAGYAGLRLRDDFQKKHHLLNSYIRFEPLFPWSNNQGIEAAIFLMKKMQTPFQLWRRLKSKASIPLRDYSETGDDSDLQNQPKTVMDWVRLFFLIFFNMPRIFQYLHSRFFSRKAPLIRRIRLRNFIEMEPREENRVLLSLSRNRLGQPLAKVDYTTSELDQKSLIALHAQLQKEFEGQGLGMLDSHLEAAQPWPIDQDASHHLGATRMGNHPHTSVVNPDLRLHSIENVYVTGGSVFPVSGCANPTYTICALSIRLAEHLKKVL